MKCGQKKKKRTRGTNMDNTRTYTNVRELISVYESLLKEKDDKIHELEAKNDKLQDELDYITDKKYTSTKCFG